MYRVKSFYQKLWKEPKFHLHTLVRRRDKMGNPLTKKTTRTFTDKRRPIETTAG